MTFTVTTEHLAPLRLHELCERHANDLWVPAYLSAEQRTAVVLDHFRRAVAAEIEMLEVRCEP